jgi:motility quorum-sensing regulator/GCU-specific mRNA interferase toxin
MEKRRPHYKLSEIQAVVADPASQPFTVTALRNGLALGLTEPEMRQVVLKLSRRDFYKAMTSHTDHQVWQDVYHGMTEEGIVVYIKITAFAEGHPPVIQFKAK